MADIEIPQSPLQAIEEPTGPNTNPNSFRGIEGPEKPATNSWTPLPGAPDNADIVMDSGFGADAGSPKGTDDAYGVDAGNKYVDDGFSPGAGRKVEMPPLDAFRISGGPVSAGPAESIKAPGTTRTPPKYGK